MPFILRPMQSQDVEECVAMVASYPVVASRYGGKLEFLAQAWLHLVASGAHHQATILQEDSSPPSPICFLGVSVFVGDAFVREIKAGQFWHGPELVDRFLRGQSPVLSDSALREANAQGGLNLLVWEGLTRHGFESDPPLQRLMMKSFIEIYQGYQLKEVISEQAESGDRLAFTLKTGGFLWDSCEGRYTSTLKTDPSEIIKHPYVAGITRELERQRGNWAGSWVGALFDYHPPILGLSDSEQRLLSCALRGMTDEEAAKALTVSLSSIKQTWLSIYRRAEDSLPPAMAALFRADSAASGLGKEKRRFVVGYVREHPEELRPLPRKRLSRGAANGA